MKHFFLYITSLLYLIFISSCTNPDDEMINKFDPNALEANKQPESSFCMILNKEQSEALKSGKPLFDKKPDYIGPNITDNPITNLPPNTGNHYGVGVYPTQYSLWTMVRFTYGNNLNQYQRNHIKRALNYWEENTNVRFYNATGEPTVNRYGYPLSYIEFVYSDVNSSAVGRQGGMQRVNILNFNLGTITHEIGHALGMFHEHAHPNRDRFINIDYDNIRDNLEYNFNTVKGNYYTVNWNYLDFSSVMIYGSYIGDRSFVFNTSIPVMTKKDGSTFRQGNRLSYTDCKWANTFYLPYVPRYDNYKELDRTVYKPDGSIMSDRERLDLQMRLNNGNPYPPRNGRINNEF